MAKFKLDLAASSLDATDQARLSTLADEYLALFHQLTQIDTELAAAIAQYRDQAHKIEPLVAEIRTAATEDFQESVVDANQMINTANVLEIGALVLAILLGFGVAILLSRSISRPVGQLTEVAIIIADGDLSRQVQIATSDEIGVLAAAFNQMVTNLRDLISQVQQGAVQVASASQQLNIAAAQAGQASQQVAGTIQQVAQGTLQQTEAVNETTNSLEQMARAADNIARGAQEQAQSVQKTSTLINDMANIVDQVGQVARTVSQANTKVTQVARHGAATVEQTSQGMDTIRTRTIAAADKVKEMGHRSKEIGRIVETIDDIADKTDMLALNAAVEAARAGEHGRGFAVVADQVRKLSEDSKGATRDIAELIERVQETVREAIAAMESTVAEVGNGARLASDTTHSLEEILRAAEDATALAEQIGSGAVAELRQKSAGVVTAIDAVSAIVEENTSVAEEMAAGSQEVMQAMEGVASVAEENSASTEEVSASAEEMSAQVEEVVASAEELWTLAEQLQAAVAQFQVDEAGPPQPEEPGRKMPSFPVAKKHQRAQAVPVLAGHRDNGYT